MKAIIAALLFASINASAATMDDAMAKVHGTCTSETCPPGTSVAIDATPGDTGEALDMNGNSYDLLHLKKLPFTVIEDGDADQHVREAKVITNGDAVYYIQWMFLKKK
ncbi:hypothetical protein PUATCC27989T_00514 [Phytobacter ursingii]|nr:hypothetical protein PUATCC27989T_00514 [Phytobacter ursingii]